MHLVVTLQTLSHTQTFFPFTTSAAASSTAERSIMLIWFEAVYQAQMIETLAFQLPTGCMEVWKLLEPEQVVKQIAILINMG